MLFLAGALYLAIQKHCSNDMTMMKTLLVDLFMEKCC